jgi:hypothetical protein
MTETENEAEEIVEFHMKGKVMREVIDAFMGGRDSITWKVPWLRPLVLLTGVT